MVTLSWPVVLVVLGILAFVVITTLLIRRIRPIHNVTRIPPPPMANSAADPFANQPQMNRPSRDEIIRDSRTGFSSQLQTSSYNIRIETFKDRTRFVVNGVTYNTLEEIPDAEMRRMAQKLLDKTVRGQNVRQKENETMRQVMMGNQSAIEVRNPSHTISVQHEGRKTRCIVDGLTYYNLKDIPDPELIRTARSLEKKMV